jgi:hypothetical protein
VASVANFDGHGNAAIVTGPDATGMQPVVGTMGQFNGIVRVFVASNPTLMNGPSGAAAIPNYQFRAYDPRFAGSVHVAAGDVTGHGVPDIVTGPGIGVDRTFEYLTAQVFLLLTGVKSLPLVVSSWLTTTESSRAST